MARKPRSNRLTDLGELQVAVLDRLSKLGEGTVHDVLDRFPKAQRPRYTTLLTVLRGLEQKGLVTHRTRDRAHVFRPVLDTTQLRRRLLRDLLKRAFGGSPRDLVAALLDTESATPDVLEEMKALIEAKENGHDTG